MASSENYRCVRLKLVIAGDGGAGKTTLLIVYNHGVFPSAYTPSTFEQTCIEHHDKEGNRYTMCLFDTGGGEDYARIRPLSYPGTDVFLLCFDITNRKMFEQLCSSWLRELDVHVPDVPRILVGCKADLRDSEQEYPDMVTYSEALAEANRLKMPYHETSSLKNKGLDECFQKAWSLAIQHDKDVAAQRRNLRMSLRRKSKRGKDLVPVTTPPKPRPPDVSRLPSAFHENWKKLLDDASHSDVLFEYESSGSRIKAHRIILCAASEFFCRLFDVSSNKEAPELSETSCVPESCRVAVGSLSTEQKDEQKHMTTVVVLQADIKELYFKYVLRYCYMGDPQFPDDVSPYDLDQMVRISEVFQLPELQLFCRNIQNEDVELNPSLLDYHAEFLGERLKNLFFNKATFSDVLFKINGTEFLAHRQVLCARSDVMAAMFSGNYREGREKITEVSIPEISPAVFHVFLEYLYSDGISRTDDKIEELLSVADQYCLPRLQSLCEVELNRSTEQIIFEKPEHYQKTVVELLHLSKLYNALQLERWILHTMSVNYSDFESHSDFLTLDDTIKDHVTSRQWPPPEFLQELKADTEYLSRYRKKYHHVRYDGRYRKCIIL